MLIASFFERIPWLLMGIWLFMGNTFTPTTTLAMFFGLYTMHTFSAGATAIIWQDYIGRVIPGAALGDVFWDAKWRRKSAGVAGATVATEVLAGSTITVGGIHVLGVILFLIVLVYCR
jgi:hypothetical protein